MRNVCLTASVLTAIALLTTSCGVISKREVIPPGSVGVLINVRGSNAGLEKAKIVQNEVWYSDFNQQLLTYPITIQNYVYTHASDEGSPIDESIQFNTKEGSVVSTDVGITFAITDPLALARTYNKDMTEIVRGPLRISARDALTNLASQYSVGQLIGDKKAELLAEVKNRLNNQFQKQGLTIESVAMVGAPRLPEAVQVAINNTLLATTATQKAQAEVAQARAELEVARIKAEQSKVEAASITPALLQKQALDNQSAWIQKWNGQQAPSYGNPVPVFQVPPVKP